MSVELVGLAVLMFAVTYPTRAVGLLAPGMERMPKLALAYLQLVGPAILTAIAAVSVMVRTDDTGATSFYIGVEWLAVAACLAIVAWRRNLFLGLIVAVAIVVVARAVGLSALPPS
ncbi:MAG TPA: AzlD domain-containing protein [Candidatus Saccharimonadales bacterium]|nr:AzlD domain-containing protein [Candidatus Saccharimonadales bacterium]